MLGRVPGYPMAVLREIAEIYIAGVIGPRADGYRPSEAMDVGEAAEYHARQAGVLAGAGADLLAVIDSAVARAPTHYLISCTHPSATLAGMRSLRASGRDVSARVIGIKANGSALGPGELDGARTVFADAPLHWLTDLAVLPPWRPADGGP